MNKQGFLGFLAAALILMAGPTLAGADVDTEADGCTVGTAVFAFGNPTVGQISTAEGQGVATRDGSGKLTCRGRIAYGTDTIAAVVFLPGPVPNVPVTLMTYDEMCTWLPLILPGQGCNGNGQGAIIIHGEEIGIPCNDTYLDQDGNRVVRSTRNWREVITPSGEATVTCHFD